MFRELEWGWSNKFKMRDHWRILLCVVVGTLASTLIWNVLFPHTEGFAKLWAGFATGASVGMILGTCWQLSDNRRRPITSGRSLVIAIFFCCLFAGFSILLMAPEMDAQEEELTRIRSLGTGDILAISVRIKGRRSRHIEDPELIESFVAHSNRAGLFFPSHEGSTVEFQITIHRTDGAPLRYDGRVPECHQDDFSLSFRGRFVWSEVVLPGGRQWLDSAVNQDTR